MSKRPTPAMCGDLGEQEYGRSGSVVGLVEE